jgi:hypothetical protein
MRGPKAITIKLLDLKYRSQLLSCWLENGTYS